MTMKRTQIYISEEMQEKLDVLSRTEGSSRSEIIREAVTEYIARKSESEKQKKLKSGAGLWENKDEKEVPDLKKLRNELDRTH
jgi:metal-responsive CopG/Arc/MetJ family transcriptional regulator